MKLVLYDKRGTPLYISDHFDMSDILKIVGRMLESIGITVISMDCRVPADTSKWHGVHGTNG